MLMYLKTGKRFLDIIMAAMGLIILSPLFLFLTILLYFINDGYPFFFQPRPGRHERIFILIKFRTMTRLKTDAGVIVTDIQRITYIGNFLRKTSLDEIPQLLNVLKGDMSLVGPRPLLPEYLKLYNPDQRKRHDILPGITGWAQVKGRNFLSWKEKFEFDLWYLENRSFKLDMKIIFLTVISVVNRKGINHNKEKCMEKFTG
jgi:undecaprenyl phosphate N,N'-diacetylbacillosamine 1-phosphate transferase